MKKIALILIVLLLVSCTGNDLVGKWVDESTGQIIEFKSDNTCTFATVTVDYKAEDGLLTMLFEDGDQVMAYEIDGDELTLSFPDLDDFEVVYHRHE